ncbi:MAG: SCO family protein [Chitinophagia bacterium]|nr:SCO family protein [Chitinophagia bacterium]
MKNQRKGLFFLAFFILLSAAFLSYYYYTSRSQKRHVLPVLGEDRNHHVHKFAFANQDGDTVTEATIKGKVVVVSYFFATCKGICPKMNENLSQVYKAFNGNDDVMILSHTVDPKRDTVKALKAYSLRFDANPKQWMFLTGDKQQLYNMARYSYLISAEDDTAGVSIDKDFIHDKHYSLVDRYGRVRGFYDGLNAGEVQKLIGDVKLLLEEKE